MQFRTDEGELECNAEHERAVQAEAEQDRLRSDLASSQAGLQRWVEDSTSLMFENERLKAVVADANRALTAARMAFEAYEAAGSGTIDEHDAFVDLRAALVLRDTCDHDGAPAIHCKRPNCLGAAAVPSDQLIQPAEGAK